MEENGKPKKERLSTAKRKEAFLAALEKSLGIITPALKACGNLSPETLRQWREKDKAFATKMESVNAIAGDFVETQLMKKVKGGDTTAIIFYCKTKLKNRGFTERQEITGVDGKDLFAGKTDDELNQEIDELKRKLDAD